MPRSLTQRNRLSAMTQIVHCAMELFDERGYQAVTVEDIAAAAGVSPSTFYRYFGTKEGVFTTDTVEGMGPADMARFLNWRNPLETLAAIEAMISPESFRGMQYVIDEPAVRAAMYRVTDDVITAVLPSMIDAGIDPLEARIYLRSLLFSGYLGALEQWHLDGRTGSAAEYLRRGVDRILPMLPSPRSRG